jgi:hypothetical protein
LWIKLGITIEQPGFVIGLARRGDLAGAEKQPAADR